MFFTFALMLNISYIAARDMLVHKYSYNGVKVRMLQQTIALEDISCDSIFLKIYIGKEEKKPIKFN